MQIYAHDIRNDNVKWDPSAWNRKGDYKSLKKKKNGVNRVNMDELFIVSFETRLHCYMAGQKYMKEDSPS